MAATEKKNMWFFSSDDGVAPRLVTRKIAASQGIFMPGAPCYMSEDGTVKLCDTSDGTDAWHGFIVGLSNSDTVWPITAELAVNTEVKVAMIDTSHLYAVYTENAGSDAAVAQTDVGIKYGLVVSATAGEVGYTTLNIAETTQDTVTIENTMWNVEPLRHAAADNPGIALVRFLAAVITAQKA